MRLFTSELISLHHFFPICSSFFFLLLIIIKTYLFKNVKNISKFMILKFSKIKVYYWYIIYTYLNIKNNNFLLFYGLTCLMIHMYNSFFFFILSFWFWLNLIIRRINIFSRKKLNIFILNDMRRRSKSFHMMR